MKKNQVSRLKNEKIRRKRMKSEISISLGSSIEPFDGPVPPEPTTWRRVRTIQGTMQRRAIVHAVPHEHLMKSVNSEVRRIKIDGKYGRKKLTLKIASDLSRGDIKNGVKDMIVPIQISKITSVNSLIKRRGIGTIRAKAKFGKGRG